MGKNKKYAKTDQNYDQSNKSKSNDSNNNNNSNGNKITYNGKEINNKNDLLLSKNKNNIKKDENSISTILWEIFDAAKYFFIMCKNFLIPHGIPLKIFLSFLILELLYQGITIYLIKSIIHLLGEYFYVWNNFSNIYIYIVSNMQMIYIFICEGLLIFRFIHFKIYLYKKLNWLINILSFIIIIFNIFEIKDLNYKIHRFYTKNLDNLASKNKLIKDNMINEYINLIINRHDDFQHYEFCYELKGDIDVINKIKIQFPKMKWTYNTYSDIFTGCRNLTFQNESLLEINSNNFFFKCDNKIDINTAPNMCVSSKYRQKRFYAQIRMALYEILILILWNLYNAFSIRIIYRYYPNLKSEKSNYSEYDNYSRKNQSSHNNKYQSQTVTFKDINDKEINEDHEEEEEEEEYEEEDEESVKKEEKIHKDGLVRVFKMRKISKRKMKTYKKKNKKRYKEENAKNKNIYFDDEILNLNYFDAKFENDEESNNNNEDEKEEYYFIKNNKYEKENKSKKKPDNKDKNKEQSDSDSDSDSDTESDYSYEDNNSGEQGEESDEDVEDNNMEQIHLINSFKRRIFENIEKYQWMRRFWKFISDRFFIILRNKIRNLLLNMDKNLKEKKLN